MKIYWDEVWSAAVIWGLGFVLFTFVAFTVNISLHHAAAPGLEGKFFSGLLGVWVGIIIGVMSMLGKR